jgi:hypothetical protein
VAKALSVTVTTTLNGLPLFVAGAPETIPVPAAMLSPAGNPVADHV